MAQITLQELTIGYRGPLLLDHVDCLIEDGDRIGLLGRNGAGKSTLLRLLCGQVEPDGGAVILAPNTHVALLPQEVPQDVRGLVSEVVASGLPRVEDEFDESWLHQQRVEQILSRMALDGNDAFERLSAGMKRRVLLARALVANPQLLLLDEPTNHLDIEAIEWLEQLLERWETTLIFVTHDRAFLRKLATRILELDRGRLFDWSCDYGTFLQRKEAALAAEEKQNTLFDKKLAEEEVWIRQGIKARRTRNMGRVRTLRQMRHERRERRDVAGNVRMELHQEERSGMRVARAKNISFAYGDQPVVERFSTEITRGDKIGIIGPNGAGKTTLLRVLLGELPPSQGSIQLGTNLQIAYFDQLRAQLDEQQTVQENVGDGYSTVRAGGRTKHILGYLQDFLFTPERARIEIRFLSGGERNRVLLAKLFAKSANVVVLDEPTNDLDAETLELLEELLVEYPGTVLLVSHDREFLNNVVTSTIAFEGDGRWKEYDGGYDDWVRQRSTSIQRSTAEEIGRPSRKKIATRGSKSRDANPVGSPAGSTKTRLSYREQQELAALPERIEGLEAGIDDLHGVMADPEFYKQSGEEIARQTDVLKQLEQELAAAYDRWEALEERAQG